MLIETERLILRDFVAEDWESVHAYASNPTVARYTIWGPNKEEDTRAFIESVLSMQSQTPRTGYELGVVLKERGQLLGGCGLHLEGTNAEIGYCFHPDYWGKGYATEATKGLLGFGFEQQGINRIYATCRPANRQSAAVMIRIGMQKEGHLRQHMYHKGAYHDSYLYSILKEEYEREK